MDALSAAAVHAYTPPFNDSDSDDLSGLTPKTISCDDLSELAEETPSIEILQQKIERIFKRSTSYLLKLAFHLIPEENKRAVRFRDQQRSRVEAFSPATICEVYSCLFPENYRLLNKGRIVAELLRNEEITEAQELIAETIWSLEVGEVFFIPTRSKVHSVVHVVKRVSEEEYEVALFNTGVGLHELSSLRGLAIAPVFCGIPLEKVVSPAFLTALTFPSQISADQIDNQTDVFLRSYNLLKNSLEKDRADQRIGHFQQRYSTCAASSLEAAMIVYGFEGTQKRVIEAVRYGLKAILKRIPKSSHSATMKRSRLLAFKILRALPRKTGQMGIEVEFVPASELVLRA